MNIFVLDRNVSLAAQYHVDRHIVKMPLETAQLLCGAHHLYGRGDAPYKLTHKNHPCGLWTRQSIDNYLWLVSLGLEICKEYTYRYGKIHKCQAIIEWCEENTPKLPLNGLTRFVEAMPEHCKTKDPVRSYRNYYLSEKQHLFSWKKRGEPWWISPYLDQSSHL